jgi:hypothetical protein
MDDNFHILPTGKQKGRGNFINTGLCGIYDKIFARMWILLFVKVRQRHQQACQGFAVMDLAVTGHLQRLLDGYLFHLEELIIIGFKGFGV